MKKIFNKNIKKRKGFTLIELLAAITILGVLMSIAIVGVNQIIENAKNQYYEATLKEMKTAGQSYFQDNRNRMPKITGRKEKVSLRELQNAKYIGAVTDYNKKPCDIDQSYVQIFKYNKNDYSYLPYLICPNYSKTEETNNIEPVIEITFKGKDENNKDDVSNNNTNTASAKLEIAGSTVPDQLMSYSYKIYKDGKEVYSSGVKSANYKTNVENNVSLTKYTPGKIKVTVSATNIYGNKKSYSKTYSYKDEQKPICGEITGQSTTWTNQPRTIKVKCSDGEGSGCTRSEYTTTFKNEATSGTITIEDKAGNKNKCKVNVYIDLTKPVCNKRNENEDWKTGSHTAELYCTDALSGCTDATKSKSFLESVGTIQSKNQNYEIYDLAGNHINCSKSLKYFIDNTAPTKPASGSIGNVSGSSTTGTIKTAAGGSTDTGGSGVDKYLYCVRTDNTVPSNTDSCFTTSKSFTRSCGTTYKAYAIAVDKVGNRSAVTGLGSTADGANSYSGWGSCSKACGTGSQTRTNSCALVTTGLKQNCNTQDCCSKTTVSYGSWTGWGACSKTCGGGSQSRSRTITYKSDYDGSVCSTSTGYDSQSCNTHSCLPKSSCKVRGNRKRSCSTWTCSGPGKHTSNYYYQHYCTNDDGTSYYKATDYNYVCAVAPYGEADGWTVVDD